MEQQKDILEHTFALLTQFNHGVPPKGSVAPWWETSKEGTDILLEKGIEYGAHFFPCLPFLWVRVLIRAPRSFRHVPRVSWEPSVRIEDQQLTIAPSSQAYYLRDEDRWTKIDYSAEAGTWMKPLQRGKPTGLVEIPANWCVSRMIAAHFHPLALRIPQVPRRPPADDVHKKRDGDGWRLGVSHLPTDVLAMRADGWCTRARCPPARSRKSGRTRSRTYTSTCL